MKFGEHIKSSRIEAGLTLREFCKRIKMDPSNWSKIERGVISPPNDSDLIKVIAETLTFSPAQTQEVSDLADVARGQIPVDLKDDELMAKMPAFFRSIRGLEYTTEDFDKLKDGVRKLHSE